MPWAATSDARRRKPDATRDRPQLRVRPQDGDHPGAARRRRERVGAPGRLRRRPRTARPAGRTGRPARAARPAAVAGSGSPADRGSSMSNSACGDRLRSRPPARAYSRAIMPARLVSSTTICEPRSNFASCAGPRQRRPVRSSDSRGEPSAGRDGGDPVGAVGHRAEPVLERQLREARLHRRPARPPGRPARRTPRPRTGPAAPPRCPRAPASCVARAVGHRDEVRQQRAVGRPHRQVALVLAHHRGQDLGRQLEVALLERAEDRRPAPRPGW